MTTHLSSVKWQACLLLLLPALLFSACGTATVNTEKDVAAIADTSGLQGIPVSSVPIPGTGKDRTFIRTADLRFRVKDVPQSTLSIEHIAVAHGGFVTKSKQVTSINKVEETRVSKDSSLETTYFEMANEMVLRVPNRMLDSTLAAIQIEASFVDLRDIRAEEVSLNLLANDMEKNRAVEHQRNMKQAITNKGRKLDEIVNATTVLSMQQKEGDMALLANLDLKDQVNFSTINLTIYARQALKREMLAIAEPPAPYQPSFLSRMGNAIMDGWYIMEDLVVGIIRWWGLLLLAGMILFGLRLLRKSNSQPVTK